jgi:Mg2+ and Co2+ transporter CorA
MFRRRREEDDDESTTDEGRGSSSVDAGRLMSSEKKKIVGSGGGVAGARRMVKRMKTVTTTTTAEEEEGDGDFDANARIAALEKKVLAISKKNEEDSARYGRVQASVDSLVRRAEILESRLTDLRVEFDEQIRTIAAQGITVFSPE